MDDSLSTREVLIDPLPPTVVVAEFGIVMTEVMVSVVTEPIRAGQSVIVAAQEVMVRVLVTITVEVISKGDERSVEAEEAISVVWEPMLAVDAIPDADAERIVEGAVEENIVALQFLDEVVYFGKPDDVVTVPTDSESRLLVAETDELEPPVENGIDEVSWIEEDTRLEGEADEVAVVWEALDEAALDEVDRLVNTEDDPYVLDTWEILEETDTLVSIELEENVLEQLDEETDTLV